MLIFVYRASQKLNLASPHRRKRHGSSDGAESPIPAAVHRFGTDFSGLLRRNPPPPPAHLLRRLGLRENPGVGKVRLFHFSFVLKHFKKTKFPLCVLFSIIKTTYRFSVYMHMRKRSTSALARYAFIVESAFYSLPLFSSHPKTRQGNELLSSSSLCVNV